MSSISHRLLRNGVLNLPRPSPSSKSLTETLLWKDAQAHHCFFRQAGLHNHLSHHILAAYDLGAPPALLQKIYDSEARIQRPIMLEEKDKEMQITEDDWVQYLGNPNAYGGFVQFFEKRVSSLGMLKTLEQFIFSSSVNEKGKSMLVRLMSGAFHPFIQVGYGLEFGNDALVSTGLAQAAVHNPLAPELYDFESSSSPGLPLLEILGLAYQSPVLKPAMPYDPNALMSARTKSALQDGRLEEMRELCSKFGVDSSLGDVEMMAKVEECVWTSVLLCFATGKEGRKTRLDFFLMHLVTSSLFLRSYLGVLTDPVHKAAIINAFLPGLFVNLIARGRPIIQPELLMNATDRPRAPYPNGSPYKPHESSMGNPRDDEDYNPWPVLIETSSYAPESHVLKTMRTLVLAAREYGDRSAGEVIGAFKQADSGTETHAGSGNLDGTVFIRAAGMLMNYMGWTTYGMPPRDDWDRSALGWDDAWNNED